MHWDSHYTNINSKAYKILYPIRHTFILPSVTARKRLYLTLVRSKLLYCCPFWRPHLIINIINLKRIQQQAKKFILNDYSLDYKSRLLSLQILPLMQFLELNDILFLVRFLKSPTSAFNIYNYISFNSSATCSSGSSHKLLHKFSLSAVHHSHFYFIRIIRLKTLEHATIHRPQPPLDIN